MMNRKLKYKDLPIKIVVNFLLIAFCLTTILPLVLTISISLTDSFTITKTGYTLIPAKFSTMAYEWIFRYPKQIIMGYKNSIIVTALGTLINLFITALIAYPLSRPDFKYKGYISAFLFFTMIFSGGMVPSYILIVKYLGWKNILLSLMIPGMAAPFNIFLLRVLFQEIPYSLVEAAKIDGSSDRGTFFRIILPLSKPALATLAMMMSLGYWNDAYNAILYIDKADKFPIQLILNNIVSVVNQIKSGNTMPGSGMTIDPVSIPSDSIMFAMMVVTSLPMIFLFTLMQKYFVKGMVSGAVKG
jgi:putative aldouronate transport system permease protein